MKNINSPKSKTELNKNTRGIIDVQFNWVFIAIVGSIIFIFIITIAFSQKSSAEKQADIQISNQITTLLKGKQQSSDVYSEIKFPVKDISFKCEQLGNESYFSFKIANAERTILPSEVIFAPKDSNTNKLIVWTQAFTTGFPVNIFSYVTTPDAIILIIKDAPIAPNTKGYAEVLSENLPSNITHKIIILSDLNDGKYKGYKNKKIICFNKDCGATITDYNYLQITPKSQDSSEIFIYGNVTFYKQGIATLPPYKKPLPYITKAGLYGAIFSDTPEYYSCQMQRAINHYEIKRNITEKRLLLIKKDIKNGDCQNKIQVILDDNFYKYNKVEFNYNNITALHLNTINLDMRNIDLGLSNCPKMY